MKNLSATIVALFTFAGVTFPAIASVISPLGSAAENTAAIQAALDAAAKEAVPGTVTLGEGTFEINAQLMVTGGVTLVGQGWESTIIKQTAVDRVVTLSGASRLERVTVTGGRLTAGWTHGAGIKMDDGTVSWCCISNNVSTGRNVYGGGVHIKSGTIDHSLIAFNQSGTYTSIGGGIGTYDSKGIIRIDTCLIYGNTASVSSPEDNNSYEGGGGIGFHGTPAVTIRNTTIAGNSTKGDGGGLRVGSAAATLVNTIVSGNTADTYENISGAVASDSANNFIDVDPLFVDAAGNDYHLSMASGAIDAGTIIEGLGDDLDGVAFASPPSVGCYQYFGAVAEPPAFNPASGVKFYPSTQITLSCAIEGATIRYTTDGSNPTVSSPVYTGPITLTATTTIKARAYAPNVGVSAPSTATYLCVPGAKDFNRFIDITIRADLPSADQVQGIPALVKLSETIDGFDYDDFTLTNGGDMMFVDADGYPLSHEIDVWNPSGESLVWVKLPSTAKGTLITMYYGKGTRPTTSPTDVWSEYTGVWHFEEAEGTYANSTAAAGIDGNVAKHAKMNEIGRFGKCFRVNDSTSKQGDNYNCGGVWVNDSGSNSPIDGGENFTISGWFKHGNFDYHWDHLFYKRETSGNTGSLNGAFAIECNSTSAAPNPLPRGSGSTGSAATLTGNLKETWGYLTFVYEGATCRVYENGVLKASATVNACKDNDLPLIFGNNCKIVDGDEGKGDAAWNGWIDEVRFSKGAKNSEWIAAEYAAMNVASDDIFDYGAVQDITSGVPVGNPVFEPQSDIFFYPTTNVTIACATEGAAIYYTTDGSEPTDASTLYTGPIQISATTTIKACAYKAGMNPSRVVTAVYTCARFEPPVLGAVTVSPRATTATISGEIASVGNNHATACDIYLTVAPAAGESGAARLIASGVTTTFSYVISGLALETDYVYMLSVSNNASSVLGTSLEGQFTTTARQIVLPVEGDAAATRKLVQDEITWAALESPAGTVTLGEGIFEIDTQLLVTDGVTLTGQGWEKTIIRQTAETAVADTRVVTIDGGATVRDLTLTGGKVTGATYQYGGGALVKNGTISWCCISNNTVYGNNVKYGGGVGFGEGKGQIDHCLVLDNIAGTDTGDWLAGGGIGIYKPSGAVIVDTCLVSGNSSVYTREKKGFGGGIGVDFMYSSSAVTVRNTTIVGNTAGDIEGDVEAVAGGVFTKNDTNKKFAMMNCIIADNTTVNAQSTVHLAYLDSVDYCLFDVADDKLGVHSIVGDPAFKNTEKGDYNLRPSSPAAESGYWFEGIVEDLNRVVRRKKASMGCYQWNGIKALTVIVR